MSKPLTIDELKALPVGDWVWIKTFYDWEYPYNKGRYAQIDIIDEDGLCLIADCQDWDYREYGETWIAYKNKEQADTKGEWVELPRIEPFSTSNFFTGEPRTAYNILYRDKASGELVIDCEINKSEAEARLKELRGEK